MAGQQGSGGGASLCAWPTTLKLHTCMTACVPAHAELGVHLHVHLLGQLMLLRLDQPPLLFPTRRAQHFPCVGLETRQPLELKFKQRTHECVPYPPIQGAPAELTNKHAWMAESRDHSEGPPLTSCADLAQTPKSYSANDSG